MQTLDLLGEGWMLKGGDYCLQAKLPGFALSILQEAGRLLDPLYRYNEESLRWVAEIGWTFERVFEVDETVLASRQVDLIVSGVDTVANISLNGQQLASTDNAHREYRFPAGRLLKNGSNTLSIAISSALVEIKQRAEAYPYTVPACAGPGMAAHFNFLRKAACDFGWDWGPQFAPAGVSGRVELVAYDHAYLTGANVKQKHWENGHITLDVVCALEAAVDGDAGTLTVSLPELSISTSRDITLPSAGLHHEAVQVTVGPDVELWWPRGYGQQHLHDLEVTFTSRRDLSNGSAVGASSQLRKRVGFKQAHLIRQPLGQDGKDGETFYFEVNGTPIFIKGANAIPADIFETRATAEKWQKLVQDAVDANMNTLRVWGGGRYPSDAFMTTCDEAGLLVWLEAMFGCALYPRDTAFLDSVAEEVRQQAFRLAGHASTLCMGGNNEVENSFGWFEASRNNSNLYAVDYNALFVDTIRPILQTTGPDIYLDSSPSNGLMSEEPYVKRWGDTQNASMGDVHFYDYDKDAFNPETFPRAKFVSEFGYQSYPSWPAYKKVTEPEDWGFNTNMSDYRQRHPNGNQELLRQLQRHFKLGDALEPTARAFRRWIYLTQMQQALVYETAVAYWRRIKTEPDARTMGVLYWQLNDIWEGPSWSSINRDSTWKLLHYTAARFFAPLLASGHLNTATGAVAIHVTSDIPRPVAGKLTVEVIPWSAIEAPSETNMRDFALDALDSKAVWSPTVSQLLNPASLGMSDAFLRVTATAAASGQGESGEGEAFQSICHIFLSEFKDAAMRKPGLAATDFRQVSATQVDFTLSAEAVAAGVAVESPLPGRFSDNNLVVLPWQPLHLSFVSEHTVTEQDLEASLAIMSLHSHAD